MVVDQLPICRILCHKWQASGIILCLHFEDDGFFRSRVVSISDAFTTYCKCGSLGARGRVGEIVDILFRDFAERLEQNGFLQFCVMNLLASVPIEGSCESRWNYSTEKKAHANPAAKLPVDCPCTGLGALLLLLCSPLLFSRTFFLLLLSSWIWGHLPEPIVLFFKILIARFRCLCSNKAVVSTRHVGLIYSESISIAVQTFMLRM